MNSEQFWQEHRRREAHFDSIVKPLRTKAEHELCQLGGVPRAWSGHFGATGIDPKHLFIYFVVPTRADTARIKQSREWTDFQAVLKERLEAGGYPTAQLGPTWLGLFSDQECQEEAKGNWYHFFK